MVDGRPWSMVDGRQNGPSQNGPWINSMVT
jgi:hypothetical protein